MNFFTKIRSCLSGATVTPMAETTTSTVTPRQQKEAGRLAIGGENSHAVAVGDLRKVKSAKSRHWKPTLQRISEDNAMVDDTGRKADLFNNQNSSQVKPKPSGKPKSSYRGEDYWKSSSLWAIPAFAPAPF